MSLEELKLPSGYDWQYKWLLWIQSFHSPRLDTLAHILSSLGIEWFYILALPVVFWSINKTIGLRLAYTFLFSMFVNGWIKDTVHVARPIGVPGIRSQYLSSTGGTWSFPSGHAQGPASFWTLLSFWVGKVWFWAFALLLIFAIGISRLYLGLHWPVDVLVGWVLGLLIGALGWLIGRWWTYRQYAFPIRMGFALAIPIAGIIYHPGPSAVAYACLLLGIGVGALLEERWWGLVMDSSVWKRICSAIIGLAGLIALYLAFGWAAWHWSTGSETLAYTLWISIRDLAMGVWGTLGAPYLFLQSGLYHRREGASH